MTRGTLAIRDVTSHEGIWECQALVPGDLPHFDGHFVGEPILPAVAQLDALVLTGVRTAWPGLGRLEQLSRLKFRRIVQPGAVLRLRLERAAGERVRFEIRRDGELCSSGTLHFGPAAP